MNYEDGRWLNRPPQVAYPTDAMELTTGDKTDFWQDTHYGFQRDDGHFLGFEAPYDFDATLTFSSDFGTQYDQAGIMLRQGPRLWVKAGIELSDGILNFSAVVTRGRSDWSVQPADIAAGPFTIRLIRTGGAVLIHRAMGDGWRLMRVADFPEGPAQIGPMACSPQRAGLSVRFTTFAMAKPPADPLHFAEDGVTAGS